MLRREDPPLLTGEARFTDDLVIPGALHLAVLRSPYAHARIASVDVERRAGAMPGVVAAYTRRRPHRPVGRAHALRVAGHGRHEEPGPLPGRGSKARYVGDGVAVVLAPARPGRADALDAIDVEYEPLDAVIDLEDALSATG